ncbi:MAG: YggS family pyridoxal phosphate-dependent enzyme [Chloroflexi bacterium]|nr:YggS family pyridoxal phosphate-dependent enzyme [Chloroflexota bacterium]
MTTLAENYARICDRLAAAARRAGREPASVRLVAVSKGRPFSAIRELYELGQRDFGENRIEEAGDKIMAAREASLSITWHMIGHIQSRKARAVTADFNWAHSVDGVALAERLSRAAGEVNRTLPILLECNVSGEEAKYGLAADRVGTDSEQWDVLCVAVAAILAQPGLQVRGLMTMAPVLPEPEQARPVFKKLRELRDRLAGRFPTADWRELSMGMTDDFEPAIKEGTTMARIGRAIFET